jgi:hypothetical protein
MFLEDFGLFIASICLKMVGLMQNPFLNNKVSEFLGQCFLINFIFLYFYESYAFYFYLSLINLIVTISYRLSG